MAQTYREVRRTDFHGPSSVAILAARVVSLVGGIITAILGIRFVLSLLGANPANPFATFIYNVSHPFVAPFFGLFNYREQIGIVRFEVETLVAIVFWAFLTWVVVHLLTLGTTVDRDI